MTKPSRENDSRENDSRENDSRENDSPKNDSVATEMLEGLLGDRMGERVEVLDLTRLSGGASRETWSFTARTATEDRPLILQRERPGGNGAGGGMGAEGALLRAAADAGVPVPAVVLASSDSADGATDHGEERGRGPGLGAAFVVTEHVDGETIPRRILRDDAFASARPVLARQAGAALAAVHRIDVASLPALPGEDQVTQFRAILDLLGEPHPAFELGLRWLDDNRPDSGGRSVVHGDFRLGNLIVGPEGLRAVLDWELAHTGDPVEDLGWFCVRAWRFGSPLRAGGVGTVEDLVEGYEAAGGVPVSFDALRWWETMGTLKWGVMCIVQAATHLSGSSRSVELAAIGRRTAENAEDVLGLVHGPSDYRPVSAERSSSEVSVGTADRPTTAELLDAVGEYLLEVRDGVTGRLGFHARVAANVVSTLRREIELGPAQAVSHAGRLSSLGMASTGSAGERELAAAIRSGALDDRSDEVLDIVRATVRDRLAVSNPGYWEGSAT